MQEILRLMGLALVCSTSLFAGGPVLHRDWAGELQIGDIKHFVQLTIAADREPMTGTIAYPASEVADVLLSAISMEHGHVRFAWSVDASPMSFDGSLSAGLLGGTVKTGNRQGTLKLAPTVTLTDEAEQRLLGYYEMQ